MKRYIVTIFATCLLVALSPNKTIATSWAYPFVVWDGYSYVVTDEYVTDVGEEISHVTKYSDMG